MDTTRTAAITDTDIPTTTTGTDAGRGRPMRRLCPQCPPTKVEQRKERVAPAPTDTDIPTAITTDTDTPTTATTGTDVGRGLLRARARRLSVDLTPRPMLILTTVTTMDTDGRTTEGPTGATRTVIGATTARPIETARLTALN